MASTRPTAYVPTGPLLLVGLYLLVMLVQASLLVPSGRSDDLETLLLSQSLEWGYQAKNPPGFYWLAHAVMTQTGPSLPAVYALRFAGMFAMVAGLYALARKLQPDPLLAVCAGFGVLATLHFHWYLFFYLSNTTLALALTPAALLAMLNLRDRPGVRAYALLGLAIGAGILARYNFALLAAGLLGAGLTLPQWRPLLLQARFLVTLGVVATLVVPHAAWVTEHAASLGEDAARQLVGEGAYAARVSVALHDLVVAPASILALPFGLAVLVCMPGALRRVPVEDPARASALALIGRTIAFGLGLVVVYALSGASYLRPHHLFLLVLVPVWLIGRLDAAGLRRWGAPAFAGLILLCCVAAAVGFSFETRRDAALCDTCAEFQPVESYARALKSEGFVPGTILALSRRQDFPTAALLHFLPDARMVAWDYARYAPPPTGHRGDCLLVWSGAEERPEAWPPGAPVPGLGSPAPPDATIGLVTGRLALSGRATPGMRYVLVKGGLGDCR